MGILNAHLPFYWTRKFDVLCFVYSSSGVVPIIYQVHRARDGSSFATRKVKAMQKGQVVFTLIASFQVIILVTQTYVNNYIGIFNEQIKSFIQHATK
jgi:acyl-CoA thioesterase II